MKMPTFEDLSEEQDAVYVSAPMDGAVMVIGPPGTGKTVMAFYRAQAVIRQKKPAQVVMFNNVLKKYSKGAFPDKAVAQSVTTWHSWFSEWWKKNFKGRPPMEPGSNFDHNWDVIFRKIIERAATGYEPWGHVVLDEGQDFPKEFYDSVNLVVNLAGKDKNSITVFADDNQRLTGRNSTLDQIHDALHIDEARAFNLTQNYRNTYQIAKLASKFYVGLRGGIPKLPSGRNGQKPVLLKCPDLDSAVENISRFAQQNNDLSIGVFAKNKISQIKLYNKLYYRLNPKGITVQRYTSGENSEHGSADNLKFDRTGVVTVLCFHSCKGLEFDAVFIPEIQDLRLDPAAIDVFKMQMYVMISRARTHLYLMYSNVVNNNHPVLSLLPSPAADILEYRDAN